MKKPYLAISIIFLLVLGVAGIYYLIQRSGSFSGENAKYKEYQPAQVVDELYNLYLREGPREGLYQDKIYISDEMIESISNDPDGEIQALFCKPVLPSSINIPDPVYDGEKAATIFVQSNYNETSIQFQVKMAKIGAVWKIIEVDCSSGPNNLAEGKDLTVKLFFQKAEPDGACSSELVPVSRALSPTALTGNSDSEFVYWTVKSLISGPVTEDADLGVSSIFSESTNSILNTLNIKDRVAYIDFVDIRSVFPEMATDGCVRQAFIDQILNTVRDTGFADEVVFAINGDPEFFYEMMGIECTPEMCDRNNFM